MRTRWEGGRGLQRPPHPWGPAVFSAPSPSSGSQRGVLRLLGCSFLPWEERLEFEEAWKVPSLGSKKPADVHENRSENQGTSGTSPFPLLP